MVRPRARARARSPLLALLFPPSGQDGPASDLTALLGWYAFPPCLPTFRTALLAALGTALLAAPASQRDRVRILAPRHRRVILTKGAVEPRQSVYTRKPLFSYTQSGGGSS